METDSGIYPSTSFVIAPGHTSGSGNQTLPTSLEEEPQSRRRQGMCDTGKASSKHKKPRESEDSLGKLARYLSRKCPYRFSCAGERIALQPCSSKQR
jgi:hypothetical protein